MKKAEVLGIITGRGGSKSVPRKNVKLLAGKPLIAWTIEEVKKSKLLTRVIVSTDDPEIAGIAKACGAEVPFLRPAELSADSVPDFDYLYHAAAWMRDNAGFRADIILRLPPTTPLCRPESIDACVELLINNSEADSSRTITPASKHPYKLWRTEGKYLKPFLSEEFTGLKDAHNMPRQSFPAAFSHVDVIALRWDTLVNKKSMAGEKILYHQIPKSDAIDIDTENDFVLAEILLKKRIGYI